MHMLFVGKLCLHLPWRRALGPVLAFLTCLPVGLDAAADVRPVVAQVDISELHNVNRHVFGVHGENLWGTPRYGDPRLADIYARAGFTYIRFPGGTTANFYRWESGDFGCTDPARIDEKSKHRITSFNQALLARGGRTYTTGDFIEFLNQSSTDFSIVVNVLCDTPASTRRWMEDLRARGADVRYVELGNELYYNEYAWRFPSAEAYLVAAESHALEVKRVFPAAKVGLVVSSAAFKAKAFPNRAAMMRHARHRRALDFDSLAARAAFADAVVMHMYSTVGATALDKLRDSVDEERVYRNAIAHFDERFLPTIRYLSDLDPGKEVWLSEWGVAFYGWLRKHQPDFDSSHYNALYFANALANMFSTPEIASANYHNLPALWDDMNAGIRPRPVFRAAELFRGPVRTAMKVGPVALSGVEMYGSGHPDYGGEHPEVDAVFFDAGMTGYLIVVNKFDKPYLLRPVSAAGYAALIPEGAVQIAPGSYPDDPAPDWTPAEIPLVDPADMPLPPFSITRIRFRIER